MKRLALHPLLFSAYFVLALVGLNIDQVKPALILRPLLVVLLGATLLWLVLRLLLKDWRRAAIAATLLLVLFFTYGHVYNFLEQNVPFLGRHRVLLPLWIILAAGGMWLVIRQRKNLPNLTQALNLISLIALAFPLVQVSAFTISLAAGKHTLSPSETAISGLRLPLEPAPDVYFIVLDEYARADVLDKVFDLDNGEFLEALTGLGFQTISCSQGNYAQTELILASILNLDYLPALDERFASNEADHALLRRLIKDSAVERAFRNLGYQIVAFETGFYFSEFEDADTYLAASRSAHQSLVAGMSSFEVLLFNSTAGLALSDATRLLPAFMDTHHPLEIKRQQVLYTLAMLPRLPQEAPSPKFVFAHILLPHEPFVFDANGEPFDPPDTLDDAQYSAAYRDQVHFLNQRLLEILGEIIASSPTPPVILLQGDTGPGRVSHAGRVQILNAIYLPGAANGSLPQTLTPVNNFRIVFDQYFGGDFGLLEDHSYFSSYDDPFNFEPIPIQCPGE
ncbi:MAG: hypothetical protein JW726_12570 [Anaerolineales bacterium]|nr:hypothetical protein [Anaerolineales bacterium]